MHYKMFGMLGQSIEIFVFDSQIMIANRYKSLDVGNSAILIVGSWEWEALHLWNSLADLHLKNESKNNSNCFQNR